MKQSFSPQVKQQIGIYLLLFTVTLIWAISWPVTEIALKYVAPFWLGLLRQFIAMLSLFIYLIITRQLRIPTRHDIPVVLSGGILFAGLFVGFLNWSLLYVPAGRASLLAYTTPLWVIILSYLFLKRAPSRDQIAGVICGLVGILILFNPQSFNWFDHKVLIGNGLLLLAALCWAIVIVHVKEHKWQRNTPLQLVPWQMLIALPLLGLLTAVYESHARIIWSTEFLVILVFLGIISSAFGFVGSMIVNQRLPAVTTSLGFLGVPIISLIISILFLGEKINWFSSGAIILIISGVIIVVLGDLKKKKNPPVDKS